MDRVEHRDIEIEGDPQVDEILEVVIHELRNPVAVMKGFATTFESAAEAMDPDAMRKAASAIHRSADRLDALLRALSDARSLDGDSLTINQRPILLSEILTEAMDELAYITSDREISVHIEDDVHVDGDPIRLHQVLMNLVSNAVKFSPKKSPIEITASRSGDEAHICVRDHGPGIPQALAEAVFDKFTRLNKTINGTGIGLYISRGIARAHGGELELVDPGGRGCNFLLRLPVATEI